MSLIKAISLDLINVSTTTKMSEQLFYKQTVHSFRKCKDTSSTLWEPGNIIYRAYYTDGSIFKGRVEERGIFLKKYVIPYKNDNIIIR
jgi:hypothetical protein